MLHALITVIKYSPLLQVSLATTALLFALFAGASIVSRYASRKNSLNSSPQSLEDPEAVQAKERWDEGLENISNEYLPLLTSLTKGFSVATLVLFVVVLLSDRK